jgi:hypothetical protein
MNDEKIKSLWRLVSANTIVGLGITTYTFRSLRNDSVTIDIIAKSNDLSWVTLAQVTGISD